MATRLFDRIGTLLRADAHGVVESLEERSLLLKQCVREAELDLDHKRARVEALREEERRLREALARSEEEIRSLDEDVALALGGGKDDLARFAIRRLLPRKTHAKTLAAQLEQRAEEMRTLGERLAAQQRQLDELRSRVRGELAREAEPPAVPPWGCEAAVADEEVELELMRRRAAEGRAS